MSIEDCERVLKEKGFETDVTPAELWVYLNARKYENDVYTLEDILSNEYLVFHEIKEIECLKSKGLEINPNVIVNNPKDVYGCHLEAMKEELLYASRKNDLSWILKRLEDLKGYLDDENLPRELREKVLNMIADFDIR